MFDTYPHPQWSRKYISSIFKFLLSVSDSKLSKPEYRHEKLEALIAQKNNAIELSLSSWRLTEQDMAIVAYYAIQENQVKDCAFYFINN